MCGRYELHVDAQTLRAFFKLAHPGVPETGAGVGAEALPTTGADPLADWQPRYNIAPTQVLPVVRLDRQGQRICTAMRWGLVPHWAKDPSFGAKTINARAETVASKPSYRGAYRARRCLVPASGFYEWKPGQAGTGARGGRGPKQPYHVSVVDTPVFAMAGLWESWRADPEQEPLLTYTIITTQANELLTPVHPRMPVILPPDAHEAWLRGGEAMLTPLAASQTVLTAVDNWVNKADNDSPQCLASAPTNLELF